MILEVALKTETDATNFCVSKEQLCQVAYSCQERTFTEEIDRLEELRGQEFLEMILYSKFQRWMIIK